jgi:hypothetical protein
MGHRYRARVGPPIDDNIGLTGDANALGEPHLNIAEHPDNLFTRVSLPCHVLTSSEVFGNSRIRSINVDPF